MNISIPISFVVPMIECSKCKMLFVLLAVFRKENEFGDWQYAYSTQERTYYCPYCGEKVERNEKK